MAQLTALHSVIEDMHILIENDLCLSLANDGCFRSWDHEREVCTVLDLRSEVRNRSAFVYPTMDFFCSFYTSELFNQQLGPTPRYGDGPVPTISISATQFCDREFKSGWNISTEEGRDIAIEMLTQIVQTYFKPTARRLRTLEGWPDYLMEETKLLPGAKNTLLGILTFVLIRLDSPLEQVRSAFVAHASMSNRIKYQLILQLRLIAKKFGMGIAKELEADFDLSELNSVMKDLDRMRGAKQL